MELQQHYPAHAGDAAIAGVEKTYASEKSMVKKSGGVINEFSGAFDFVIVFPMKEVDEPGGSFRREQSDTAKHVMHAMLNAGLEIYPYLSVQDDELLVLFRAPVSAFHSLFLLCLVFCISFPFFKSLLMLSTTNSSMILLNCRESSKLVMRKLRLLPFTSLMIPRLLPSSLLSTST